MNFKGYDLALITDEKQRQYFLGFHSTAGYVMLTPKGTTFVVDSRYISAAKKALEPKGIEVILGADFSPLKTKAEELGVKTIAIDFTKTTVSAFEYYKTLGFEFVNASKEIEQLASIKTEEEISYVNAYANKEYFIDVENAKNDATISAAIQSELTAGVEEADAIYNYFVARAQDAVVVAYEETVAPHTGFGWIKNIWTTDASYKHPVLGYEDFKAEASREKFKVNGKEVSYSEISAYTNAYNDVNYELVTAKLSSQKEAANGYFILVALSIGTILLQQFVAQRSQKAQNQYSSVDGQAASQQKMTMVIMTGMFAIFSFMYSSAFSIYMITSNLFSLFSTLIINKVVDVKTAKKESEKELKRYENHAADRIEKAKKQGKASAEETKKKK